MKIPKAHSYLRLVAGFFLIFAAFFIAQSIILRFGIINRMIPSYNREKREMAGHIREEILRDAKQNPRFNLDEYITRQNKKFSRLKLEFIREDHQPFPKGRILIIPPPPPRNRRPLMEAVPLTVAGERGYLVLYSNGFQHYNGTLNLLSSIMLFALLPALVIGFFMFRKGYKKSSLLLEAVEQVSQGNYQTRVDLSGNDEYGLIGQAFNKMAASIEKSTQELKKMDQQRRQFITDISHELATPLTSIKGYVETLQMEELHLTQAEQAEYLEIVKQETERLTFLVKDLLELGRMDAGTITLEPENIDCSEFLKAFINRNALRIRDSGVQINWETVPGQLVYADYRRLEQILQNLLDNALKHSAKVRRIEIRFMETPEITRIRFSDDGCGIAPEHLSRIFDRFYRVSHLPKENNGAWGLGLAIVKGLVELHGGTITVQSGLEQGTTFELELPRKKM